MTRRTHGRLGLLDALHQHVVPIDRPCMRQGGLHDSLAVTPECLRLTVRAAVGNGMQTAQQSRLPAETPTGARVLAPRSISPSATNTLRAGLPVDTAVETALFKLLGSRGSGEVTRRAA